MPPLVLEEAGHRGQQRPVVQPRGQLAIGRQPRRVQALAALDRLPRAAGADRGPPLQRLQGGIQARQHTREYACIAVVLIHQLAGGGVGQPVPLRIVAGAGQVGVPQRHKAGQQGHRRGRRPFEKPWLIQRKPQVGQDQSAQPRPRGILEPVAAGQLVEQQADQVQGVLLFGRRRG